MPSNPYVFEDPEFRLPKRRRWHRAMASLAGSAVAVAFLTAVGAQMLQTQPGSDSPILRKAEPLAPLAPRIALRAGAELLDPNYSLGHKPTAFSLEPADGSNLINASNAMVVHLSVSLGRGFPGCDSRWLDQSIVSYRDPA